jgi:hypothetical protein
LWISSIFNDITTIFGFQKAVISEKNLQFWKSFFRAILSNYGTCGLEEKILSSALSIALLTPGFITI